MKLIGQVMVMTILWLLFAAKLENNYESNNPGHKANSLISFTFSGIFIWGIFFWLIR